MTISDDPEVSCYLFSIIQKQLWERKKMSRNYLKFRQDAESVLDRLVKLYDDDARPLKGRRNSFNLSACILYAQIETVRRKVKEMAYHADMFERMV